VLTTLTPQDREHLQANNWRANRLAVLLGQGSKVARALVEDILEANAEVLDTSNPSHNDTATLPDPSNVPCANKLSCPDADTVLNVGLFVGHTPGTGAKAIDGSDEWESRNKVAEAAAGMLNSLGFCAHIIYRDGRLGYATAMREHGKTSRALRLDVALELHFNAYDGQAHGAEIIVASQSTAAKLGGAFKASTTAFYPGRVLRGGGVKLKRNGRGYLFNANQRCPSGIYEPFFGDSSEWYEYADDVEKEARYVTDIIKRFHDCPR